MQLLNKTSKQLNNLEQRYIKDIRAKNNEILKLQRQIGALHLKIDEINKIRPQVSQRETQEYELTQKGLEAISSPVAISIPPNQAVNMSEMLKEAAQRGIIEKND